METSNILTNKWAIRDLDIIGEYGSNKHICEMTGNFMIEEEIKEAQLLIVTAVNACKAINPNNPIKVAEVLPDMVDAIKIILNGLSIAYGCGVRVDNVDVAVNGLSKAILYLQKATE